MRKIIYEKILAPSEVKYGYIYIRSGELRSFLRKLKRIKLVTEKIECDVRIDFSGRRIFGVKKLLSSIGAKAEDKIMILQIENEKFTIKKA